MNDQRRLAHLTDSEFTDLLLGSIPPSVTAHLESCAECAQEARSVSGAILNFERQSRAWAEHRAAGQTALVTPGRHGSHWLGLGLPGTGLAWQAAAALTLICAGIGIGNQIQHRSETAASVATVSSHSVTAQVSATTLKADNELLSAIAGELQAEVTPPPSVYGLDVSGGPSQSHRVKRVTD
jgi:hypothetical protein